MKIPPRPPNEAKRLDALRNYDVLDTLRDQALDDLTALAAHICEVPISLISLVDENRQWFKSAQGLSMTETARNISFCAHAINQSELFIVPDATKDERFVDSSLVTGDTHVRFYAGAPLVTYDGYALGTLCVFDRVPRKLTPAQEEALRVLGRQVMAQLDLRRQTRDLVASEARLFDVFSNCPVGVAIHRWSDRTFVDVNRAFMDLFGYTRDEVLGRTTQEVGIVEHHAAAGIRARLTNAKVAKDNEILARAKDGTVRHLLVGSVLTDLFQEPHTITTFVDITARKEAEVTSSLLAAIVESSADAIIGKDTNGIVTSWNSGASKIFGYSAREMIGSPILKLIPEDRTAEEHHILGKIRRGERVEHFETVRRRKDGQLIDVSVTSSPIRDVNGQVVGASKIARDITTQKRSEGLLREREEQLRLYAEHSPAAIAMFDREMRYLVVSQRWKDVFRTSDAPLIGRSLYESFPELAQRWRDIHRRTLAGAIEKGEEDPFPRADGRVDWMRWETRPWHQADGSIGGIIIFIEDITERKLAGAALRASEERMRFALENAEIGIWDIDYHTGVVRWSETLEAQYGLAPGSFSGSFDAVLAAVHPEDRAHVAATFADARHSGEDFTMLSRSVWPNGEVHWLNGAGRIHLDEHGKPVRGVGISMDITQRRSLEEQYQQAQKMEAVGRLAGGVAHDFNNLLTVILGYCELLLRDLEGEDERRTDVVEIQSAGNRASRLTRQLLAFSRKQIIEPTLLDINQIATDLQAMLARLIGEDIAIELRLGTDLELVLADRGQLEQIVMNLAVNARDAMPNGGTLTIETANVVLDESYVRLHPTIAPGKFVAVTVTDTGTGMSAAVQARIFEPFFTTKDAGRGTGLGMATVYGIVTQSRGCIDVSSEIGQGTSFTIHLPAYDGEELQPERFTPAPHPERSQKRHTLLLVEDEDGLRELTRKLLERHGYAVIVASNVTEAEQLFRENPTVDVLLTDVVMPGGSGPELTTRLSELRPALKVIYMSGYTEEAIVHHGVIQPGISFLEKPFTYESLGDKIRQVLAT